MARRKSNRWQARVGSFKHQPRPKVKEGFSSSALVEAFFHRKLSCACAMILLLSLVFLTYLRALTSDFITYDDQVYVTGNYHVQRGLTWEGVKWAFYTSTAANWHPLTWMSHMLDCTLFGLNAWGHHLTSLLLHVANTFMVFLVLRRMTGAFWRSWFVAGLFGLHPLHVESVAWVAERKDVLSGLFWLLTWLGGPFFGAKLGYVPFLTQTGDCDKATNFHTCFRAIPRWHGLQEHGFYGFLRGFFRVILLFLLDCSKRWGGVGVFARV